MAILITGAAGFIGQHLYPFLKNQNFKVYGTSANQESDPNIFQIDITHQKDFEILPQDIDTIIHLAAVREDFGSDSENRRKCMEINANGTLNVVKFAAKRKMKRFIYISSNTIYGKSTRKPKETDRVNPESHYGYSKHLGEVYCREVCSSNRITLTILRLASVFGRHQNRFLVCNILDCIINNRDITIYGKGEGRWDLIYIKDLLDVLLKVLNSDIQGIYNIGSGKLISVKKIAETALDVFKDSRSRIVYAPEKNESKDNILMDIAKAEKEIGLKIRYPLKTAFEDIKTYGV